MTPREKLQRDLIAAERERDELRGEMDAVVETGGGHVSREMAEDFRRRIEEIEARLFFLRGELRKSGEWGS